MSAFSLSSSCRVAAQHLNVRPCHRPCRTVEASLHPTQKIISESLFFFPVRYLRPCVSQTRNQPLKAFFLIQAAQAFCSVKMTARGGSKKEVPRSARPTAYAPLAPSDRNLAPTRPLPHPWMSQSRARAVAGLHTNCAERMFMCRSCALVPPIDLKIVFCTTSQTCISNSFDALRVFVQPWLCTRRP